MADFRKPVAPPPLIFLAATALGVALGFIDARPVLALYIQLLAGLLAVVTGVWLIAASMRAIRRGETTYNPYAASTRLVTTGIYSRSRNPGYLGLAVIQLGIGLALDNYWVMVTLIAAIIIVHYLVILREEEKLKRTFGETYVRYMGAVHRWL